MIAYKELEMRLLAYANESGGGRVEEDLIQAAEAIRTGQAKHDRMFASMRIGCVSRRDAIVTKGVCLHNDNDAHRCERLNCPLLKNWEERHG